MPQGNYMPEGLLSGISFKTAAESAIKQAIGFVEADVIGEIERNASEMKVAKEA